MERTDEGGKLAKLLAQRLLLFCRGTEPTAGKGDEGFKLIDRGLLAAAAVSAADLGETSGEGEGDIVNGDIRVVGAARATILGDSNSTATPGALTTAGCVIERQRNCGESSSPTFILMGEHTTNKNRAHDHEKVRDETSGDFTGRSCHKKRRMNVSVSTQTGDKFVALSVTLPS